MTTEERLKQWVDKLTEEQKDKILLSTIDMLIDFEEIVFYDDTEKPYWSSSGDNLDK